MEIWLSSTNKGKIAEFQNLIKDLPFELHTPSELKFYSPPDENGDSFLANATLKAKALHALKPEAWTVADDSGLMVDGLGGLPGVHSARYAGPKAQPSENNAKLLKMMQIRGVSNRHAAFHCSLVVISPDGESFHFQGLLEGQIATQLRGQSGFGYDPLFIPQGETRTLAEMTPGEKNAISHRGKAFRALVELLKQRV